MITRYCTMLFLLMLSVSCNSSQNDKLIVGHWAGAEWLAEANQPAHDADKTSFSFDDKGNYSYEYGGLKEAGTYKVENDMLFTKPAEGQEIMVKITKLTKDSLVFEMNRAGTPESLVLLRNEK